MDFYQHASNNGFDNYKQIIDNIHGYLCPGQPECLFSLANICKSGDMVEIGSFKGKSSCCIATGIINQEKHLCCIDPFTRQPTSEYSDPIWEYSLNDFNDNINKCNIQKYITPIQGFSEHIGANWNKPISFLFVDGGHTFEYASVDINNFIKWLIPGGVLLVHDVDGTPQSPWAGVYNAWMQCAVPHLVNIGSVSSLSFGFKK